MTIFHLQIINKLKDNNILIDISSIRKNNKLSIRNNRTPLFDLIVIFINNSNIEILDIIIGPSQPKMNIR